MKKNNHIQVAVYGLFGSYTHQAGGDFFEKNKLVFKSNILMKEFPFSAPLFDFVKKGNLGFLPIENSSGGSVTQTLDLFFQYNFEIIGEYYFPINHVLLGSSKSKISDIKEVFSHPQALAQCSNFLVKNKIKHISFSDTAAAALVLKDEDFRSRGVIGSSVLSDLYGLKILKRNFQNLKDNVTRFILVKKQGKKYNFDNHLAKKGKAKTSIVFEGKGIPGALYKCLGGFATNGVNLTKIESRPSKDKNFDYFFYIDFEGSLEDGSVKNAVEELAFFSKKIKILGSYKTFKK